MNEVSAALVSLLKAVFRGDPQQIFGFLYFLAADNGFQPHWPEISLAALYADEANFVRECPWSYREILIDCPVDVFVYDENNRVISQIAGETVSNALSVHGSSITQTGTKQVILPSDAAYNIHIQATNNGEMSVSVLEYDSVLGLFTLLRGYQKVQIHTGETYQLIVPEYIPEDYHDEEGDGSTTLYRLIGPNGREIASTISLNGENIKYHEVAVGSNNQKGIVTGGGRFVISSFAQVQAYPMPTVEFLGWYNNGKLVSADETYRFPVNENTDLVAQFSEGSFNKLSVSATSGGSVNISEIELPEAVEIQLIAEPEANFKFIKWETTSGHLQDDQSAATLFTMPANDAAVTAVFARTGPANFNDVAVPSDTFTFKKVWEGGSESSIDFTLYKLGDTVYHHGFNKKIISRTEWQYNAWFSKPVACYVIEEPVPGYKTRYENVGVYADITDRCCDGGTIINYKVPKTGDDANLLLWQGCVLAGLTAIFLAVYAGKRKKAKQQ